MSHALHQGSLVIHRDGYELCSELQKLSARLVFSFTHQDQVFAISAGHSHRSLFCNAEDLGGVPAQVGGGKGHGYSAHFSTVLQNMF